MHFFTFKMYRKSLQYTKIILAIICRDDVCFSLLKAVGKSLNEIINKCPRDWEIIQLGINNPEHMKLLSKKRIRQLEKRLLGSILLRY